MFTFVVCPSVAFSFCAKIAVLCKKKKKAQALTFFTLQDSTSVSEVQGFFKENMLPLVGHRKPSNDAKRYTKRPLVVVYYGVDFSFDYRKGTSFTQMLMPNSS